MNVVGHCRFSYFGTSDTGRAIQDVDKAMALLWNPQRMAVRFHLFEKITLPSIRNQTDQDFQFAIIASEQMPGAFRDRLEALVEGDSNIRILWTSDPSIKKASRPLMLEASNDRKDRALHFRLDDDDGLAADYVRRLKLAAEPLDAPGVISFTRGIIGYLDHGTARHRPFRKLGIAIGYGIVKEPHDTSSPFSIQHTRYAEKHLGHRDDEFVAYHYTRHSTNNTNGYDQVIHRDGRVQDAIAVRARREAPELVGARRATEETDAMLKTAFPFSDGPSLRKVIEETLDPQKLTESFIP
ncbi:MAG: glycosyltransferase [Paracoccus sp. (in: a-proteobacteria)]|nr:glycosyltransferase [Paracoccus sp. (in: a-proteobacteria)]